MCAQSPSRNVATAVLIVIRPARYSSLILHLLSSRPRSSPPTSPGWSVSPAPVTVSQFPLMRSLIARSPYLLLVHQTRRGHDACRGYPTVLSLPGRSSQGFRFVRQGWQWRRFARRDRDDIDVSGCGLHEMNRAQCIHSVVPLHSELHKEQLSIENSMRDLDSAVGRLDNIFMSVYTIIALLIFAVAFVSSSRSAQGYDRSPLPHQYGYRTHAPLCIF